MSYGKAIKTIRLIKGLGQEDLASAMHMDVRTIREIEHERRNLTAHELQAFSDIFLIDIKLIYELANEQVSLQNIVHEAKRDGIVVNQGDQSGKLINILLEKVIVLENRITVLEQKQV